MAAASAASTTSAASTADALPEKVTFAEHVAPILFENCTSCHRPNDVAPMSLLSYGEARPWAKSIARVVMDREMPPWDANPKYGKFENDPSLSEREIALIERWARQGAPQGDATKTPPVPAMPPAGSWRMGEEPDLVIDLAAVEVPADGPDLFVTQVYGVEIPEDKWLRAIELLPDNNDILHHVVTYLGPFGISDEDEESNAGVRSTIFLNDAAKRDIRFNEAPRLGGVWVAGSPPTTFREGTGQPLSKNEIISLNMHYHPSGNAGSDSSKLGLYFGEGELEKQITTAFAADPGMLIPPGAADHRESAVYYFAQDSKVLSLLPHMHQRGKSMRYTLERPDGTEEVVLDVPAYDYDWQNIYYLEEPLAVPAGSVMRVEASWDNSEGNPVNPDASLEIPWGDGTNYEMLVAFIDYIVDDGVAPKRMRVNPIIDTLLDRHGTPERAYAITVDGMGFAGNWGLVLPEQGEPTFYMIFDSLMFSASIPEVTELESGELAFNGSVITSGGGTRMPLGFLARRTPEGGLEGEVFMAHEVTASNVEEYRGKGRAFTGTSRQAALDAARESEPESPAD